LQPGIDGGSTIMPSAKSFTQEALRLLQSAGQGVYLLDEDRRILLINDALSAWLGIAAAELQGRFCRFQSAATDPLEAAADGLSPPPEAFHGKRVVGVLSKYSADGSSQRRRVEFLPLLADADEVFGVIGLVDRTDLAGDESTPESDPAKTDEPLRLHELTARLRKESAKLHALDRLAGQSPEMVRVRAQVKLAAATNVPVLIVGPPGIGRQHVARTIHFATPQTGLFTPVACGTLPAEILREIITSISPRRAPVKELPVATILLADVDQLPPDIQEELVRTLAGSAPSARILSTSTTPLEELVEAGKLRSDLAHLLGTLVIELPTLHARHGDIPAIAQFLLEDLNAKETKQLRGFSADAMDRLMEHDWPGQIDELASVVRDAFQAAEGYEVTADDLPKRMRLAAEAARYTPQPPKPIDLEGFLARIETELIERALHLAKGNKTSAARLLGLNRPRLYRRMVQLGLERDNEPSGEDVADGE
jgi:transcriptional regulator with PAS, ATPase and Fis domain